MSMLETISKCYPAFEKNCISVVFSCNDHYAKYLSVALQSVIENSTKTNNYDIFILHSSLSKQNQDLINSQCIKMSNFSCRFINVNDFIHNFSLNEKTHITKETFYRLLILELLRNFSKAIYLDCDLVVDEDIANLYNINVSKYYLGACRDIIGISAYYAPYGIIRKRQFIKLNLDNFHNYFNAGVLLLNLSLMNQKFNSFDMLKMAEEKQFPWQDQDILNLLCQNNVLLIDDKWNMTNHYKHRKEAKHAPKDMYDKWDKSSKKPSIYHFTGAKIYKPWFNPFDYPAEYFWKYAYKSPFYQSIIDEMLNQTRWHWKKDKMLNQVNKYLKTMKNDI